MKYNFSRNFNFKKINLINDFITKENVFIRKQLFRDNFQKCSESFFLKKFNKNKTQDLSFVFTQKCSSNFLFLKRKLNLFLRNENIYKLIFIFLKKKFLSRSVKFEFLDFANVKIFLPAVLISGFIIFNRYSLVLTHKFVNPKELHNLFVNCCTIAEKVLNDFVKPNEYYADSFNIKLREFNFNEAMVMNGINYNCEIRQVEIDLAIKELYKLFTDNLCVNK